MSQYKVDINGKRVPRTTWRTLGRGRLVVPPSPARRPSVAPLPLPSRIFVSGIAVTARQTDISLFRIFWEKGRAYAAFLQARPLGFSCASVMAACSRPETFYRVPKGHKTNRATKAERSQTLSSSWQSSLVIDIWSRCSVPDPSYAPLTFCALRRFRRH